MGYRAWRVDGVSITRAQFFTRIVHCAFRELPFVIDSEAVLVEATQFALRNGGPLYRAFHDVAVLGEFHKGGVRISDLEVLEARFPHIAEIETSVFKKQRIDLDAALLVTLEWLRQRQSLPPLLCEIEEICFDSVFDFTQCEFEILIRLAELSQTIRFVLPIDYEARALLLPIQDLLTQLESRALNLPIIIETPQLAVSESLTPFFKALFAGDKRDETGSVRASLSNRFDAQVDWVCDEVSALRDAQPRATIAIAFRTLDVRFRWFEEALRRRQVPFRVDMGVPLKELPEIKTLMRHLRLRLDQELPMPFSEQLHACLEIIKESPVSSFLRDLKERLGDTTGEVSRYDFYHWLSAILERRDVGFKSPSDADAVDLVSVKQLWSRSYEYVFLPDLAQGRFPRTEIAFGLGDEEKFDINRLLGKRVFGFIADSPTQDAIVPAKQGLESLWFVGAIRSAQKGLYLSSSRLDPKEREQAPSEFLSAALRVTDESPPKPKRVRSNARVEKRGTVRLEAARSRDVFARWLGLDGLHPLTPTRLEAFAVCPFRALVQRIFGIDDAQPTDFDLDPRVLGRFVHAVLESYFKNGTSRQGLKEIIESKRELLSPEGSQTSIHIIEAHLLWLTLIIERAVSNMLKDPPVEGAHPKHFEYAVGFRQPHTVIMVGIHAVSLGGIIDRVDVGEEAVAIVDYKMSSMAALRQKASDKELLETHFQMPIYVRILLGNHPELRDKDISAHLISIRDGSIMRLKDDLKDRAIDDERSDGLYAAVNRVMSPILDGTFDARKNESCPSCYLKRVCRV